jgi:TPR repeat protein
MYYKGEGVPKDYSKAAEWLVKAAEQGHANAQFLLGTMYTDGKGVLKDSIKAAEWLAKAAEQGDASAQHIIGMMYADGDGVPKDLVMAYKWTNLAGASANESVAEKSRRFRDSLAKVMTPEQIAEAQRLSSTFKPTPRLR